MMAFEGLNGFGKPSFPIFQKSDADGFACPTKTHPLPAPQLGNSLISSKKNQIRSGITAQKAGQFFYVCLPPCFT
jgi:hypothetical protein